MGPLVKVDLILSKPMQKLINITTIHCDFYLLGMIFCFDLLAFFHPLFLDSLDPHTNLSCNRLSDIEFSPFLFLEAVDDSFIF